MYYPHQVSGTDPVPKLPVRGRMKAVTTLPTRHWSYWKHPPQCQESWASAIFSGLDYGYLYPLALLGKVLGSVVYVQLSSAVQSGGSEELRVSFLGQGDSAEGGMVQARCVNSQI